MRRSKGEVNFINSLIFSSLPDLVPEGILLKKGSKARSIEFSLLRGEKEVWYQLSREVNAERDLKKHFSESIISTHPYIYSLHQIKEGTLHTGLASDKWQAIDDSSSNLFYPQDGARTVVARASAQRILQSHSDRRDESAKEYQNLAELKDAENGDQVIFAALKERFRRNDSIGIAKEISGGKGETESYIIEDAAKDLAYKMAYDGKNYQYYVARPGVGGFGEWKSIRKDAFPTQEFVSAIKSRDHAIYEFYDEANKIKVVNVDPATKAALLLAPAATAAPAPAPMPAVQSGPIAPLIPPVLPDAAVAREGYRQEVNKLVFQRLLTSDKSIFLNQKDDIQYIEFHITDPSDPSKKTSLMMRHETGAERFVLCTRDHSGKKWQDWQEGSGVDFYGDVLRSADGIAQDIVDKKVGQDDSLKIVINSLQNTSLHASDATIFESLNAIFKFNNTVGVERARKDSVKTLKYTIKGVDNRKYSIVCDATDPHNKKYSYLINGIECAREDIAAYFPKEDFIFAIRDAAKALRKFHGPKTKVAVKEAEPTALNQRCKQIFEGLLDQKNGKLISILEENGNRSISFYGKDDHSKYKIVRDVNQKYTLYTSTGGEFTIPRFISDDFDVDRFLLSCKECAFPKLTDATREIDIFDNLNNLVNFNSGLGITREIINETQGDAAFTIQDNNGNSYKMTFEACKIVKREVIGRNGLPLEGSVFSQSNFISAINDAIGNRGKFYDKFDKKIMVDALSKGAATKETELEINRKLRKALLKTIEEKKDIGLHIVDENIIFQVELLSKKFVLQDDILLLLNFDDSTHPLGQEESEFFYGKDLDFIMKAIEESNVNHELNPFRILRADEAADCDIKALWESLLAKNFLNDTAVILEEPGKTTTIFGVTMGNGVKYGIQLTESVGGKEELEYVSKKKDGEWEVCKKEHFPVIKFIYEINARTENLHLTIPEDQRAAKATTPAAAPKPTFTTALHNYKFRAYKASDVKQEAVATIKEFIKDQNIPQDSPRFTIIEEYKKSLYKQNEEPRPKKAYRGIGANVELVKESNGEYSLKINKIFDESDKRFKSGAGYVDGTGMKGCKITEYFSADGSWKKIPSDPKEVAKIFHGEEGIKFKLDNSTEYECESDKKKVFVTSDCTKKVNKTVGGEIFDAEKHGIEVLEKSNVATILAEQKKIMPTEEKTKKFSKAPLGFLR